MTRRSVENPVRDQRCLWLAVRADGSRTPCCAKEQWQVVLRVQASRNHDVVCVVTPFTVCSGHKRLVKLSVILHNGGWARVQAAVVRQGKKEPRLRHTELSFERITDLEVKRGGQTYPRPEPIRGDSGRSELRTETATVPAGHARQAS
jgi:hypothetical protein